MADDPEEVVEAVSRAEAAFDEQPGPLVYETGLDPLAHDPAVIQLRKACRLLEACDVLGEQDGYYTSVIEMSFAGIERTLEFYALTASNDTIDDFREGHDRAYDRAVELNLITEETARRLKQLYRDNRAATYYRDTVAAKQQAERMSRVAAVVHDHVTQFARQSHDCICGTA